MSGLRIHDEWDFVGKVEPKKKKVRRLPKTMIKKEWDDFVPEVVTDIPQETLN